MYPFEERATDIDIRWKELDGDSEPENLLADRSALLHELDARGLLSDEAAEAKLEWLRLWNMTTLESWFTSARRALKYLVSRPRPRAYSGRP